MRTKPAKKGRIPLDWREYEKAFITDRDRMYQHPRHTGTRSKSGLRKYVDEKKKSTHEIDAAGRGYTIKQIDTPVAKDQATNGKVFAKISDTSSKTMIGTVTDLSSGKEYSATWVLSDDGSLLTMTVKAGILHIAIP